MLNKEYIINKKSVLVIAEEYDISSKSSVEYYIKKFDLYRDPLVIKLDKKFLLKEYIDNNKSLRELSKELKMGKQYIRRELVKYGIPIRKHTKSQTWLDSCIKQRGHKHIPINYWSNVIYAANKRGLKFTITLDYAYALYLRQNGKCALSGVDINFRLITAKSSTQTCSLDRKDSSKGYIRGNVQWVHKTVNLMKMSMSDEELIEWCELILINRGIDL